MNTKRLLIGLALVGAAAAVVCVYFWWTRPPQMGTDADVFRAVDALYTAVTARDEKLLQQCERRLRGMREAGKLPKEAAVYLDAIIATAREGRWQSAAERLYDFMIVQRRASG